MPTPKLDPLVLSGGGLQLGLHPPSAMTSPSPVLSRVLPQGLLALALRWSLNRTARALSRDVY
jgi:hypothetical protein